MTCACVGVLLLLLAPAAGEARRESKSLRCLNNLSRIGQASFIHAATDPNEFAVPVHRRFGLDFGALGMFEWGGKSGQGEPQSGNDPEYSKWGTGAGRGPSTRALNSIIYGRAFPDFQDHDGSNQINWKRDYSLNLDVFRCPSDTGYSGHHLAAWKNSRLSSFDHYGNSYAANAMWVGRPGGACRLHSNSPFLKPLSRIPNPANAIQFMENAGLFAWRLNYGVTGCTSLSGVLGAGVESPVHGWHGRSAHFQSAFSDGHSATIRMRGHTAPTPDIGRYPPIDGIATNYTFWRCAIIRGPGWQLDTLPAPATPTTLSCSSGGVVTSVRP